MAIQTIGQLFAEAAGRFPEQPAFTLLKDGEQVESSRTYGESSRQVRLVAARLQGLGLAGERILLLLPMPDDFAIALLGCMAAGAVPVLAYPPRLDRSLEPLEKLALDAGAKAAIVSEELMLPLAFAVQKYAGLAALQWFAVQQILRDEDPNAWADPGIGENAPALLSYTSGSTSDPRGVLLSHGNLLACLEPVNRGLNLPPQMTVVACNPMFHIGTVTNLLVILWGGGHTVFIPTRAALERPAAWLRAVTRWRANASGGFNALFQQALANTPAEERAALDLSTLKHVMIGGERINGPMLEQFCAHFAPAGFDRGALITSYGMTESAGFALATHHFNHRRFAHGSIERGQPALAQTGESGAVDLVSCGAPLLGRAAVVDPETCRALEDGQLGEIWLKGPQVASGYWNRPVDTTAAFQAQLQDAPGVFFLRTGDLGFRFEGEVYIAGRLKEVIILNGHNYYAPDIEQALAGAHPAALPGGAAAIGAPVLGEERLCVLQEVREGVVDAVWDSLIRSIREKISESFEQPVYAVALVEAGSLPRTPTGKVQRYLCAQEFQAGRMKTLKTSLLPTAGAGEQPAEGSKALSPVEGAVLGIWIRVLNRSDIGIHDNLFASGGNSLHAAQIAANVRDVFQVEIPLQVFFEEPTIAGIAKAINQIRGEKKG